MRRKSALLAAAAALALPLTASAAAVFYSDDFDTDTSANYTVNADADTLATFSYDYSAMGIPSAPNSVGGTTKGVQFKANYGDTTAAAAAINISPTGQSFTGDYILKFDVWMNINGPLPGGGAGSTEFFTGGVGTAGTSVQKSSGTSDGAWFAADGEGGSGIDYRAYRGTALEGPTSTAYAAPDEGTTNRRNANNTYYHTAFPGGQEPPQFQKDNYPQQTGGVKPGAIGFEWREVEVFKIGNDVSWVIDGLPIATLTNSTLAGNNVFVGYWDVFSSISDNADLSFGVIDNLQVTEVPEPASLSLLGLGAMALMRRRRQG